MLRRLRPLLILTLLGWAWSRMSPETQRRIMKIGKELIQIP